MRCACASAPREISSLDSFPISIIPLLSVDLPVLPGHAVVVSESQPTNLTVTNSVFQRNAKNAIHIVGQLDVFAVCPPPITCWSEEALKPSSVR